MSDQPSANTVNAALHPRTSVAFWLSLLVFLAGAALFAWTRYTNSDGYQAKQDLSEAEKLVSDGQFDEAAKLYRNLADKMPDHADAALTGMKKLLGDTLDSAPLAQVPAVLKAAYSWPDNSELREGLAERGMELVRRNSTKDPGAGLELLLLSISLARDPKQREELSRAGSKMLEEWNKANPENVEVAVAYVKHVLHPRNDFKGTEKVLGNLQDRLKATDGTYYLAWSRAAQGKPDDAIALLEPFCTERVPLFLKADKAVRRVNFPAQRAVMEEIQQSKAEGFDYEAHAATDEEGKQRLIAQYLETRLQKNTEVQSARAELANQQIVVKAVMELGQLELTRVRNLTDPAAQQAAIDRAEKAFTKLRDSSAESFVTYIGLAQASFWVGKPGDAQKHLDEMMERSKRKPFFLAQAAEALRSAGDFSQGRKLLEEAYEKETDKAAKQEIALRRSRAATDIAEEIEWIRKAGAGRPDHQLALSQALARQAEQEGRVEEAIAHLRQALKLFEKLPRGPFALNEEGMVRLWLFRLNKGDKSELDKGVDLLEKAVKESPDNPLIIHNAALNLYQSGCFDLLLDSIESTVLRTPDGLDNLMFLYSDKQGREEQAGRVRKHEGLRKASDLAEKLLKLQPLQPTAYELLVPLHLLNHDAKALQALVDRLKDMQPDQGDAGKALEALQSKQEEMLRKARAKAIPRWEKLVTQMSDKKAARSQAAALVGLVRVLLRGGEVGEPPDADRVVKLAEEAVALHPCRMTTQKLIDALLYRAHRQLVQADADYKKMAERTKRSLDSSILVALALTRDGPTKSLALANADVVKVCKMLKERSETFPDEPTPWLHAMLQAAHPEAAAKVAQALKTDDPSRLALAITLKLKPLSLPEAIERYWALKLDGKEKDGEEVLRRLSRRGVALPFDVK